MRFTLIKDLKKEKAMVLLLRFLLLFIFLYTITNIFVKSSTLGLSVTNVTLTLFGSEENFIDPLGTASFLELIHTEIFFVMMVSFILSAIFIRIATKSIINRLLVNFLMLFALGELISLGLAYFVSDSIIIEYLICFYIWHALLLYMTLYSVWRLFFAKSL